MEIYITSIDPESYSKIKTDRGEILEPLGSSEDAIAISLQKLFTSVIDEIRPTIETESELTVEIECAYTITGKGELNYLFLKTGGEGKKESSMKVTLSTTLKPKEITPRVD